MTLFQAFGQFAGQAAAPSLGTVGMEIILPTSITNSGGTATLGSNGTISFSGITSVTAEGIFSSTYTNYMIVLRAAASAGDSLYMKLRVGGSDSSASYVRQYMIANGTSTSQARNTLTLGHQLTNTHTTHQMGSKTFLYGPNLALDTHFITQLVENGSTIRYMDSFTVHEVATAYTGATFATPTGSQTGTLTIYGMVA